ncbi:MAG: DUF2232 domain-containing protein [Rhodospirillales bacterium]|jgi:hypothetical protein
MNPRDFVFPVAAGAAAAILTMAALSATLGGIVLSSLAQLPIFLVGLSLGAQAAAVATASSFAVASIMVRVDFGFFFALAVGVPATILVRQALLWRPRGDDIAWYPPAGLLLVCLGLTTAVAATALPAALWPSPEQVQRARAVIENLPLELRPSDLPAAAADDLISFALGFLPGFLGLGFFVLLAANAAIAQALLVRFGLNLRPTPGFSELALPPWFTTAAAIAGIGALLPGVSGVIGGNLALICAIGFLFAGLAVLHAIVLNSRARGPLLALAYGSLLFAPAIVAVMMLGIAEPWTRLRERFAGPAPRL